MSEWLAYIRECVANIRIEYIIGIVVVLFIARLILGKYKTPAAKSATELVESALIAIVLVFLVIRPFIVQAFYIPSGSMLPTLELQDQILVNKFIYRFHEPQRGDIIVFKSPPEANDDRIQRDFIKRLVGVPGDVIEVRKVGLDENGEPYSAVFRNGERLKEPYLMEQKIDYERPPEKIPEGMLFVMGDNRNYSKDSHVWGDLDRHRVIGKAMVRFWPLNRMGLVR